MNKLILTLSFGILASSAFAGPGALQTGLVDAYKASPGAQKFVGTEQEQHDGGHDAKETFGMLKSGQTITKTTAENAMKKNY